MKKKYSPNLITKALGYMHMFFLRYIIKWDFKKYPKNSTTYKFFNSARANDLVFEKEKKELIQRLKTVINFNQKFIINPMHGKISKEVFKKVIIGHTSYHLNQFGVL